MLTLREAILTALVRIHPAAAGPASIANLIITSRLPVRASVTVGQVRNILNRYAWQDGVHVYRTRNGFEYRYATTKDIEAAYAQGAAAPKSATSPYNEHSCLARVWLDGRHTSTHPTEIPDYFNPKPEES